MNNGSIAVSEQQPPSQNHNSLSKKQKRPKKSRHRKRKHSNKNKKNLPTNDTVGATASRICTDDALMKPRISDMYIHSNTSPLCQMLSTVKSLFTK